MKKNTIYSVALSAGFVVISMGSFNLLKVENNDPQLLKELIDLEEIEATQNTPTAAKAEGRSLDKLLKQCKTCHTFENKGKNKTGPNLFNVYMDKIAINDSFKYSNSFKNANIVWNDENLDQFLTKPSKFIPKTKMAFNGFKKAEERAKVIEFLKTLK